MSRQKSGSPQSPAQSSNEPLRVLVVDDEPLARRRLRRLLEGHHDFDLIGESSNGMSAIRDIAQQQPDLIFLDIQMPGVTGFDVVSAIGPEAMPEVVFVTAYDQHALDAFEVNAVDYLLKPFDDERFEETLARAKRRLSAPSPDDRAPRTALPSPILDRLAVRAHNKISLIDVESIDWIEAEGNYVRLHTGTTSRLMRETLSRLARRLDGNDFVRIHRSTMVRVSRVRELAPLFHGEYSVILTDGTRLKLSRTYRDALDRLLPG